MPAEKSKNTIVGMFALTGVVGAPASALALGLFVASASLGFLILFGIEFLIGVSAFWLVEVRGLYSLVMWGITGLLSGYFLPLEFFPRWLATLARALPFPAMVYTPAAVYAGSIAGATAIGAVLGQLAWVMVLLGAGLDILRRVDRASDYTAGGRPE